MCKWRRPVGRLRQSRRRSNSGAPGRPRAARARQRCWTCIDGHHRGSGGNQLLCQYLCACAIASQTRQESCTTLCLLLILALPPIELMALICSRRSLFVCRHRRKDWIRFRRRRWRPKSWLVSRQSHFGSCFADFGRNSSISHGGFVLPCRLCAD